MSFRSAVEELSAEPLEERLAAATGHDVERALRQEHVSPGDFLSLLSPAAGGEHLESMAARAHDLTLRHFGRRRQIGRASCRERV